MSRVRRPRALSVVIRPSGRDEAETHFALQRAASLEGFAHVFPPDLYPFPDEDVRRRWREFTGTVLLAERDGRAVGVAAFEACWLHGLYVAPEAWGTGVASALHDAALETMPDCPEFQLWTLSDNGRARRFYERRGWRLNGKTRVVPFPPNPLDVGYSLVREEP
jgi:GNAT superfamily N-acetyltransferase